MATAPTATVLDHYLALGDAGAFEGLSGKVELIGGRIVIVNKGRWHARAEANLFRLLDSPLRAAGYAGELSPTVPLSDTDAPDPDLVFVRADAEPLADVGTRRIRAFAAADYGLVVEVADTTLRSDTSDKALAAARAGIANYWVVHRGGAIVFTEPSADGYGSRVEYAPDAQVAIPHTASHLDLATALDVPAWAD